MWIRRRLLRYAAAGIVVVLLLWSTQRQGYFGSIPGRHERAANSARSRAGQNPCHQTSDQWPLFPQFLKARRLESSADDLPPFADVFATGSACADSGSRRYLQPTIHFILDLQQPDEGKRTDDSYKRWFPEPTFSTSSYRCVFPDGNHTSVSRTRNHDQRLWPSHGDCSQVGRFRLVVLTCPIPLHLAKDAMSMARPNLEVVLKRYVKEGSVVQTGPIPVICGDGEKSCTSSKRQAIEGRKGPRPREQSIGICTMVRQASGCSLKEWLLYYLYAGVDGAYIFDNSQNGEDSKRLAGYINHVRGYGTLLQWPPQAGLWWVSQTKAVNSCLRRFSAHHNWIIVSDLDERIMPLQKPDNFIPSLRSPSLLMHVLNKHMLNFVKGDVSSLIVRNWDMRGTGKDKSSCMEGGQLLIEQGNLQCKSGPSGDRMKSIFSTDLDKNELVDQGHCTVIGQPPSELNPEKEMRMNHYWSNTASKCNSWEDTPGHLLTSNRLFISTLKDHLKSLTLCDVGENVCL